MKKEEEKFQEGIYSISSDWVDRVQVINLIFILFPFYLFIYLKFFVLINDMELKIKKRRELVDKFFCYSILE